MVECPNCQAENDAAQRYCSRCGSGMHPATAETGRVAGPRSFPGTPSATLPGPTARAGGGHQGRTLPGVSEPPAADDGAGSLVGSVVDRYRVLELVGRGGMGAVYKVEHTEMGKVMAMKVLHRDLARDRDVVRRFKREAQAVSRLTHVNIVSVFDFGRSSTGFMYLIMEYIRGEDLGSILKRDGHLAFPRACPILVQICGALADAHEAGIIHRDLKPENILVARTKDGHDFVKVLDFGLAKLREESHGPDVTGHGHVVGTPYYMSPEQIRAEPLDHRSDIYSLGALTYRVLTGENPFQGSSAVGVLTKHLTERLIPPRQRRPDLAIPESAERIVMRAMAREREERYQSVDALRADLEAALGTLSSPDARALGLPSGASLPPPLVTYVNVGRRASHRTAASGAAHAAAAAAATSTATDLSPPQVAYQVSTREDWDRYERLLLRRRWLKAVGVPLVLGVLGLGAYLGLTRARIFDRPEETEPNNVPEQANALRAGAVIRGHIGGRLSADQSDNDWFRIELPSQGPPQALEVSLIGIPNIDVRLELFDAQKRLFTADATGVGGREVIPNWRLGGRLYYVRIHEAPVLGKPPTENPTDYYTLEVRYRRALPSEELEPNDQPDQAVPVRLGARLTGFLGSPGDVDWFRLRVSGRGRARVRITPIAGVDSAFLVPGKSGTPAPAPASGEDAQPPHHRQVNSAGPGSGESVELEWGEGETEVLFAVRRIEPARRTARGQGREREGEPDKPTELPGLQIPYTLSVDELK